MNHLGLLYPQVNFPNEWLRDRAIEPMLNHDFWLESIEEK